MREENKTVLKGRALKTGAKKLFLLKFFGGWGGGENHCNRKGSSGTREGVYKNQVTNMC